MSTMNMQSFTLPNGHLVNYIPTPDVNSSAYILEVKEDETVLARYCSCNGVSIPCPHGTSPSCDCTKNPPSLSCV